MVAKGCENFGRQVWQAAFLGGIVFRLSRLTCRLSHPRVGPCSPLQVVKQDLDYFWGGPIPSTPEYNYESGIAIGKISALPWTHWINCHVLTNVMLLSVPCTNAGTTSVSAIALRRNVKLNVPNGQYSGQSHLAPSYSASRRLRLWWSAQQGYPKANSLYFFSIPSPFSLALYIYIYVFGVHAGNPKFDWFF